MPLNNHERFAITVTPDHQGHYGFSTSVTKENQRFIHRVSSVTVKRPANVDSLSLQKGDQIVNVNDKPINRHTKKQFRELLVECKTKNRGEVKLTVKRQMYRNLSGATSQSSIQELDEETKNLIQQLETMSLEEDHGNKRPDKKMLGIEMVEAGQCSRHPHWKVYCKIQSKTVCPQCVKETGFLSYKEKTQVKELIQNKHIDDELFYVEMRTVSKSERCAKHKHLEIIYELPCGEKVCYYCLFEDRKVWTDCVFLSEFYRCSVCKSLIPRSNFTNQISLQRQRIFETTIFPISLETEEACEKHKHWKIIYEMPCGKRVCYYCLFGNSRCPPALSINSKFDRCRECFSPIPKDSFTKSNFGFYPDTDIMELTMSPTFLETEDVCEIHKHWKIIYEMPCGKRVCYYCLFKDSLSTYSMDSTFDECNWCYTAIPKDAFTERNLGLNPNRDVRFYNALVRSVTSEQACSQHKHWMLTYELPCGKKMCFRCLKERTLSRNSQETFDICTSCYTPIASEMCNPEIPEKAGDFIPFKALDTDEMCQSHIHWKVICLLPCKKKVCLYCISLHQTYGSRIQCPGCNERKMDDFYAHVKQRMADVNIYRTPIKEISEERCTRHPEKTVHIQFSSCKVCISCVRQDIEKQRKIDISSEACNLVLCPCCFNFIPLEAVIVQVQEIERKNDATVKDSYNNQLQQHESNNMSVHRKNEATVEDSYNNPLLQHESNTASDLELHRKITQGPSQQRQATQHVEVPSSATDEKKTQSTSEQRQTTQHTEVNGSETGEKANGNMAARKNDWTQRYDETQCQHPDCVKKQCEDVYVLNCGHGICFGCLEYINKEEDLNLQCVISGCGKFTKIMYPDSKHKEGNEISKTSNKSVASTHDQVTDTDSKEKSYKTSKQSTNAWRSPVEISGLGNIGATCYANSILQVLGQTPQLIEKLRESNSHQKEKKEVTSLLLKILEDINSKKWQVDIECIEQLMQNIFQRDPTFRRYRQNDCHSFIMSLLDILQQESQLCTDCDTDVSSDTNIESAVQENKMTGTEICHPVNLFKGLMKSIFTYNKCEHNENSEEQMFYSLLIPIQKQRFSRKWNVKKGIATLMNKETFGKNALPCRTCEKADKKPVDVSSTVTTKQLVIAEAPTILVLQLARFTEIYGHGRTELVKNHHPVQYEELLTIVVQKGSETNVRESKVYQLYGVVLHCGSLGGGHYYSFVKKLSDGHAEKWFSCSDSYVKEMRKEYVYSHGEEDAFLLFYKLIDTD